MTDAQTIHNILLDCLFRKGEATEPRVEVQGVVLHIGFHPARLDSHRAEIREQLLGLPQQFMQSGGMGWSFLNACMTADGEQWANHQTIDELICLGMAIELVEFLTPREMWSALPGGVPYFVVKDQ